MFRLSRNSHQDRNRKQVGWALRALQRMPIVLPSSRTRAVWAGMLMALYGYELFNFPFALGEAHVATVCSEHTPAAW